jgi:flavin reductase (DIM6/NTAB) family NADH-FMN oxidoreductase RutF
MKTKGSMNTFYNYAFPMPTVLVTSKDMKNNTNIITIAWHTTISRNPPLYGISVSPKRYSHGLIKQRMEFVINFLSFRYSNEIHFCGTTSGKHVNKIKETGLTLEPSKTIETPSLKEGYANLECILYDTQTLGDHTLFIGRITYVSCDQDSFDHRILNNQKTKPILYLGDNNYCTLSTEKEIY